MADFEFFATWAPGFLYDDRALGFWRREGHGIETRNDGEQMRRAENAGLKVALHVPGSDQTLNLSRPDYMSAFNSIRGQQLLHAMQAAYTVSFHMGYANTEIVKIDGFQDYMVLGQNIRNPVLLANIFINNTLSLREAINKGAYDEKNIELESTVIHRDAPQLRRPPNSYLNAAKEFITDPRFFRCVLDNTGADNLADGPHLLITANTMAHNGTYPSEASCLYDMAELSEGRTHHFHINRAAGNRRFGYIDAHLPLTKHDYASGQVLELIKDIMMRNEGPYILSFEIYTKEEPGAFLDPMEHVEMLARQRDFITSELENTKKYQVSMAA